MFGLCPFLLKLYADAGYQGPKFQQGLARVCRAVNVEIVRRCDGPRFVVLPKRWIVERTIAWLNRCRRLGKDWECLNQNANAFLKWASVRLMLRRLCQNTKRSWTDSKRKLKTLPLDKGPRQNLRSHQARAPSVRIDTMEEYHTSYLALI